MVSPLLESAEYFREPRHRTPDQRRLKIEILAQIRQTHRTGLTSFNQCAECCCVAVWINVIFHALDPAKLSQREGPR